MLTTRRLIVAITFVSLLAMATRVSVDSDTWWHLRAGEWMLEHRAVLDFDAFSHTRAGEPWVNHSWLSEIPMALIFRGVGYAGLNLWTALMVALAFAFVYWQCEGGALLRGFAIVLAATASAVYWSARPQMVTFLFAAIFGYVLWLYRSRGVNRLWLLVPLMALWVNLHGGFAVGFILLGLTAVGEAAEGLLAEDARPTPGEIATARNPSGLAMTHGAAARGRRSLSRLAWLAGAGLACVAAVTLSPYGLRMLLYPFETVSIGVLKDFIQEWQSPNFHSLETHPFIWLLLAIVGAVGFSGRRLNVTDLLLISAFGYMALLAGRNISLFALVAAPVLTRHAAPIVERVAGRFPALVRAGEGTLSPGLLLRFNWLVLALVVLAAGIKMAVPLQARTNEQFFDTVLPVRAVRAIREDPPPGRMFNSYNWGGYLTWALYPDVPVFVDGRTDLYADAFLREYLTAAFARQGWRELLDRYRIGFVLIETDSSLAEALAEEPGWVRRYADSQASVFVRNGPNP